LKGFQLCRKIAKSNRVINLISAYEGDKNEKDNNCNFSVGAAQRFAQRMQPAGRKSNTDGT
jgi:hypothetical protein